ncbi:MAG: hypothetical protein BJ554DRAFT_8135 [Olpidium bornovanus]|uniref:Uncharacterized protein n=1 Tax=Olpidium bornovanus TaxID=278681 RepID=A0A8H8A1N8_9FUNG|nr:MAG: hypothetical protein BJ554DRAFT_8135 [Olpidium bornovanus]
MDVGGGADETDEEIRRLREQLDRLERLRQHHHVNVTAVSSPPGGLAAGRYNPTLPQATAVAGVAGGTVGSRAFLMEPAAQTHAAQSAGFARPLAISSRPQAWADPSALGDVGLPTYPPYVGTPALPIGPDGAATPGAFSGLPSKPVSRSWSAAAAASANEHWPQVKRTGGEPASPTLFGSEFHASPSHGELLPPNAASNAAGAGARSSYSFAAPGPANNAARRPEDPVAPDGGLVLSSGTGLPNYYQYWTAAEPGPMEPHVAVAPAIFGAMNGQINMRGLGAAGGAAGCGVVQGSYVGVGQTAFPVAQPRHANRQGLPAKAGSPAYPDGIMRYAQPGNEAPLADRADSVYALAVACLVLWLALRCWRKPADAVLSQGGKSLRTAYVAFRRNWLVVYYLTMGTFAPAASVRKDGKAATPRPRLGPRFLLRDQPGPVTGLQWLEFNYCLSPFRPQEVTGYKVGLTVPCRYARVTPCACPGGERPGGLSL